MRKKFYEIKICAFYMIATILISIISINDGVSQDLVKDFNLSSAKVKICKAEITRTSLDGQKEAVQYHFNNDTDVSPYTVTYNYVQSNFQMHIELPIKSFLADLDMYLDEEVNIVKTEKDIVDIPNVLEINQNLSPVSGSYNISVGELLIVKYDIELSDRKVTGVDQVELNGKTKSAFLIHSKLELTKTQNDGNILSVKEEIIYDWFVPSHGIVKRQRMSLTNGEIEHDTKITETHFN